MVPELVVELPLKQQLSLNKFHNISVNDKYKDSTITCLKLFTDYTKPGLATLYVTGIDKDACRFTKQIRMSYITEVLDINAGVAKLHFKRINAETWYPLDKQLAKTVLNQ